MLKSIAKTLLLLAIFLPMRGFAEPSVDRVQHRQEAAAPADYQSAAQVSYPHGDFYIMTGNLEDGWTDDDYTELYPVVKWLSKKGFRVIVNPIAFTGDLREAVENPRTAAIIWNGHGSQDGVIWDADNKPIPADTFVRNKSAKFKFLFFANCWGKISSQYYGLSKIPYPVTRGWYRETTSDDMFGYLMGDKFKVDLEKALDTTITEKPHDDGGDDN